MRVARVCFLFIALAGVVVVAMVTPAAHAQSAKPKPARASSGGADSQEGWIIKRTQDGRIIKIPRRQTFKFGASDVSGDASRPAETLLGNRQAPREATLIPERRSYRREVLEAVGLTERRKQ